jgi:hypothetical protein
MQRPGTAQIDLYFDNTQPEGGRDEMIEIDHICLGVKNVYEGSQRLREETGLGNYEGGWFPELGLANRIVPLGDDTYIEVESVVDVFKVEEGNRAALWFRDQTAAGDVFIGWCARATSRVEMGAIAKRLGSEIIEGNLRTRPDGSCPLAVRVPDTATCWAAGLPNFFYTEDMARHPGRVPIAPGPGIRPHGIAWMELGGSAEAMSDWLGIRASSLPLRFNGKTPGLYALAVKTERGEVVIRRRPINSGAGSKP